MKKKISTTPSTFSCSRTLLRIQNVPARPMGVLERERGRRGEGGKEERERGRRGEGGKEERERGRRGEGGKEERGGEE